MDRYEIIRKVKQEMSSAKGCNCKKKKFAEEKSLENVCWPGYIAIGLKPDGSPNCVPEKEEQAKVKEGFPIPSPDSDEDETKFIGRCNSELYEEYPDDAQRNAICYKAWESQ